MTNNINIYKGRKVGINVVKTIRISLEDKKYKGYAELKKKYGKTWEEMLDVAFKQKSNLLKGGIENE